jgi:hypothetical protein
VGTMTEQHETKRDVWFEDADEGRDRRHECIALALALERKREQRKVCGPRFRLPPG